MPKTRILNLMLAIFIAFTAFSVYLLNPFRQEGISLGFIVNILAATFVFFLLAPFKYAEEKFDNYLKEANKSLNELMTSAFVLVCASITIGYLIINGIENSNLRAFSIACLWVAVMFMGEQLAAIMWNHFEKKQIPVRQAIKTKLASKLTTKSDINTQIVQEAPHQPKDTIRDQKKRIFAQLEDDSTREAALTELEQLAQKKTYALLDSLYQIKSKKAGVEVVKVLGKFADAHIVTELTNSLLDATSTHSAKFMGEIIKILSCNMDDVTAMTLIRLRNDRSKHVRDEVATALTNYPPAKIKELTQRIKKEARKEREELKKRQDYKRRIDRPVTPLLDNSYKEMIDDLYQDHSHRRYTVSDLIAVGKPIIPSMIRALDHYQDMHIKNIELLKEYPNSDHVEWQEQAMRSAVRKSLQILTSITKKDFGLDVAVWKNWWDNTENQKK